jgi:tetratricopeptide (TPR) repeat protein
LLTWGPDNNDAQSWYLLGRCYMSQQKYPKAYEAYQQAVYRDGRNPTFWCSIGVLYYQINQYRDALDAYSRAIRLNPFISEVWYDLGTLVSPAASFVSLSLHKHRFSCARSANPACLPGCSTNPATTRLAMPSTPTSARLSWIPTIHTSRLGCSCCDTVEPTGHRPARLRRQPTYIPKHIRPMAPLGRNGPGLGPGQAKYNSHHQMVGQRCQQCRQTAVAGDCQT